MRVAEALQHQVAGDREQVRLRRPALRSEAAGRAHVRQEALLRDVLRLVRAAGQAIGEAVNRLMVAVESFFRRHGRSY